MRQHLLPVHITRIEKTIKFYIGYLDEEKSVNYISPMITETVKAQIKGTEQRLARLLFAGGTAGVFTMCLCTAAKQADENMSNSDK